MLKFGKSSAASALLCSNPSNLQTSQSQQTSPHPHGGAGQMSCGGPCRDKDTGAELRELPRGCPAAKPGQEWDRGGQHRGCMQGTASAPRMGEMAVPHCTEPGEQLGLCWEPAACVCAQRAARKQGEADEGWSGERKDGEQERGISRNASSPDAISQVGFCSGSWHLSGTAQPASAPARIPPLPRASAGGKAACALSGGRDRDLCPSATISGSATQELWSVMCQFPGTITHPSICQASPAEPLPASPGCCPCVLSLPSPAL